MHQYSVTVLIAVTILIAECEINAYRFEMQAFDATEPLLRFQKHFSSASSNSRSIKEPHLETLTDVLLAPWLGDNSPMGNITERCNAIMLDIATQGSRFTFCMLSYARPFRVCEHCLQNYIRFTQMYEDLMDDQRCSQALLLADKMHVMNTMYNVFINTWSDADCDMCYDTVQENTTTGVVTYNFTADTLLFQQMQANVTQCFNDSDTVDDHGVSKVCVNCKHQYSEMNSFFSSLKLQNGGHICMDLIDMMNYTRLMWSSKFYCRRPKADASIVIAIAVMVSIVTVLLYTSSKFITKIRMPQIFKAKRMAPTAGRYGAISHEEVETSLPRYDIFPSRTVEHRRTDSNKDVDGSSHPGVREHRT